MARADLTYSSDVSVALLLIASDSAAAPASLIWFFPTLQRSETKMRRVRDACSWRDLCLLAQSRSRARAAAAAYEIDVSVALLLSASESAAAPASPIALPHRLQQGEERTGEDGQECSRRDLSAQSMARAT